MEWSPQQDAANNRRRLDGDRFGRLAAGVGAMTLPPDRIGDKGQRFELHVTGWPLPGDNVIGWGEDKWSLADTDHDLLTSNPRIEAAHLLDRKMNEIIEIEP